MEMDFGRMMLVRKLVESNLKEPSQLFEFEADRLQKINFNVSELPRVAANRQHVNVQSIFHVERTEGAPSSKHEVQSVLERSVTQKAIQRARTDVPAPEHATMINIIIKCSTTRTLKKASVRYWVI